MSRLTLDDVPEVVTFVDERGKPLPEYGELRLSVFARAVALDKARRWHQTIDTTLQRMMTTALRDAIRRAKAAS